MNETYAAYVGANKDKVGYNGTIFTWEAFKALCPVTVSSLSIADFYIDNPSHFATFLNRVAFLMNNINIVPGHTVDHDFWNNRPCVQNSPEQFPNLIRGPWETDDNPEIDTKMRDAKAAIMANTAKFKEPVNRRATTPVFQLSTPPLPEFVPSEERWSCLNCGEAWPMNAIEQDWIDGKHCPACR